VAVDALFWAGHKRRQSSGYHSLLDPPHVPFSMASNKADIIGLCRCAVCTRIALPLPSAKNL
jgi:hypothetical protein